MNNLVAEITEMIHAETENEVHNKLHLGSMAEITEIIAENREC